ncbi:hypothetical protein [Roseinatronobacter sp.]
MTTTASQSRDWITLLPVMNGTLVTLVGVLLLGPIAVLMGRIRHPVLARFLP